jgi:hypothetical protein
MMLAALSSLSIVAHAQTDFFKDIQISGFFDMYYQYSGNQPTAGKLLPGRQFDVRDNSFSLSAAVLSVVKPTSAENPWGFTINLLAGKTADIETSGEPNDPNGLKHLHQAYVTYASPTGLTVDLGKFGTWVGLESPFAVNNDLYSLSSVFFGGQPTYHAGIRATKAFSGTTVGLYGVNGINEAEDSNRSKSYGASLAHTFGKVAATVNYYGGNEGASGTNGAFNTGESNWQLGDLILVSQLTDKLKLSFNGDYGSIKALDAGASNGHFTSYQVVGKYQFTKAFSVSARYDNFFDMNGARFGTDARLNSEVIGCEYLTGAQSVLRFEVRHDESNRELFESDGSGGNKARTTFTLAHIFKF